MSSSRFGIEISYIDLNNWAITEFVGAHQVNHGTLNATRIDGRCCA